VKLIKHLFFLLLCTLISQPALAADWTRTVKVTPEGGYLIGNPAAPVKVIEYFSLTCGHCRHFTETGMAPLKANYVAKGKVSVELRNFVLNAPDLTASLLMRCGSPAKAVELFGAVFAAQEQVFGGLASVGGDAQERINAAPLEQRPALLARESGIEKWFVSRGIPAKRAAACLTDPERSEQLVALRRKAAENLKVQGTPTFFVNGALVDGAEWNDLEPVIVKALGG